MLARETTGGRATTLLIVDGHAGVRVALARRLGQAPGITAAVAVDDLDAAVRLAAQLLPEVIVCDPRTLPAAPTAVVRVLAATGAAVVVLTSSLDEGEAATLERAGARAVVLKGSARATLVASVQKARVDGARAAPLHPTPDEVALPAPRLGA